MSVDDEFISYLDASLGGKLVEIVTLDQLSADEIELILTGQADIAGHSGRDAVERTWSLWRQAIPGRLPRLLDVIDRFGHTAPLTRVTLESEPNHPLSSTVLLKFGYK
ncbi:hypothetical protein [Mycobacteroides abscessus]|uniref:hypothetical protein n=1 Tax=Mycobacteroides abscessus TaxID=36809 RepID=UPI000C258DEF|nr:hypothetical protein [Mycobacteroides abscessus]RIR62268.1 hypothetical protein D2E62_21540 [Mycobacteroides abscessus]